MTLDEAIKMYTNNAEYERTHGSLQGCLEFRQLAEWLKDYKRLLEQEPCDDATLKDIFCMGCDYKEQESKTGHWIQTNEFFINQDGQFIYKFICSECKSLSYFRKSNKKAIGANVCPNCGAKMQEVEDNG